MKLDLPKTKIEYLGILKNTVLVVLGTFVLSFGTGLFIIPFELVTGGVSGIGIILNHAFSRISFLSTLTTEIYASIINWILFFIGLIVLGRSFAMKTLVSTAVYPIALQLSSALVNSGFLGGFFNLNSPMYADYGQAAIILAAVFGGAAVGAGCALTFLGGGSTGGVDIIALCLCKKIKSIKSSVLIFIIDATVVVMGMFVIRDLVVSLLGIISALICAVAIDRLFLGESKAFIAQIVTDKYELINQAVIETLDRTTTISDCVGGYSGREKKMIMVTFSINQYADFLLLMSKCDKNAFVTLHRAHEINGEGWKSNE